MSPALGAWAFLAGLLDAIVGGGGLIQLPALLLCRPETPVAAILGTNKFSSVAGLMAATVTYARRVELRREFLLVAATLAAATAVLGAWLASQLATTTFRPLAALLLVTVGLLVVLRPTLGVAESSPADRLSPVRLVCAVGLAAALGGYDGFFGPGTGTLLIVVCTILLRQNFLVASAHAKVLNLATNMAALLTFAAQGAILWRVAVPMALCNMLGAALGARLAIARGSRFVRALLLLVVAGLVVRLIVDMRG